jgi:hypothetical protein
MPTARGICPGLTSAKPALVVARVEADGNPAWLSSLEDLFHICVYTADAAPNLQSMNLQVPANRGHEAMAYLTFIIDNYNSIPEAAVFVHGSRFSWHNDDPNYDNLALLKSLNLTAALTPSGYHNLRCDHSASTCDQSSAPPQGSLENSFRAILQPYDPRVISDAALPRALSVLFGGGEHETVPLPQRLHLGRGDAVRAQCCAQFAVSRESIRQHSRDEYIAVRQWLLDGRTTLDASRELPKSNAAPVDDRVAGRILSYIWHILFIKHTSTMEGLDLKELNRLACPSAAECYCRLYSRCELEGCSKPGRCRGQYQVPPNFKLPSDWTSVHS